MPIIRRGININDNTEAGINPISVYTSYRNAIPTMPTPSVKNKSRMCIKISMLFLR